MHRWYSVIAASFVTLACARPATQVLVWAHVAEASSFADRIATVRVLVEDGTPAVVFDESRPAVAADFPLSVSVLPQGDDETRTYRVTFSLFDGAGAPIATEVAEGSFTHGVLGEIHLVFDDTCGGRACGEGRTCIAGRCERACFSPRPAAEGTAESVATSCPCRCVCPGDTCLDGLCVPSRVASRVTAGHEHACALDGDGAVYCWGRGDEGALGDGTESHGEPRRVTLPSAAVSVAAGARHTCVVLDDGRVFCFGDGAHGAVGPSSSAVARLPALVPGLTDVVEVGAGGIVVGPPENHHTCAVRRSGEVLCWGSDDFGQRGRGSVDPAPGGLPPAPIVPNAMWDLLEEVELGAYHTCARHAAGRVFCWGRNHDWQLGFEDRLDRAEPATLTDGTTPLPAAIDIAAGTWHGCAVTPTGELYCWGEGGENRCGIPRDPFDTDVQTPTHVLTDRSFVAVDCGHRHSCAIESGGTLWCFGTSAEGELGVASAVLASSSLPVAVADDHWQSVALGTSFTCGIREGGALYCWGRNDEGQLGTGDGARRVVPARVCLP